MDANLEEGSEMGLGYAGGDSRRVGRTMDASCKLALRGEAVLGVLGSRPGSATPGYSAGG